MRHILTSFIMVPLAASLVAQGTDILGDASTLQRVVELVSSAGVIGVLVFWLRYTLQQMEAQRLMFQRELEAERIAHESTRRMLIDVLKEQRPMYSRFEGDTKPVPPPVWNERVAAQRVLVVPSGDEG